MSRKNIDNIFPEKDKTKKLEENKGGGGEGDEQTGSILVPFK